MKRLSYSIKAKNIATHGKRMTLCCITLVAVLACNLSLVAQNNLSTERQGARIAVLPDSVTATDLKTYESFSDISPKVEPLKIEYRTSGLFSDPFVKEKLLLDHPTLIINKISPLSLSPLNFDLNATGAFLPGLLNKKTALLDMTYLKGKFSAQVALVVNQYQPFNKIIQNQFGIAGGMEYQIYPHISTGVFGTYYSSNPFFSMASMPYVSSSSYGAWIKYENEKRGIRLGTEYYYDSFSKKWNTVPIISPIVKIGKRVRMEFPLGEIFRSMIDNMSNR